MILQSQQFLIDNRKHELMKIFSGKDGKNLYKCLDIKKNKYYWITSSKFEELKDENKIELL